MVTIQASEKVDLDTLDGLLRPKAVTVVGASNTLGKIGHTVVKNLVDSQYEGSIYPINPKSVKMLGIQAYPSVLNVPYDIEAVILICSHLTYANNYYRMRSIGYQGTYHNHLWFQRNGSHGNR